MYITDEDNPRLPFLRDKTSKLTTSPGCYIMKNNDKKDKKNKKNKSKFNDYTSFLNPEIVASDPQGMYTGVPADMYYNGELEKPIQDADDL